MKEKMKAAAKSFLTPNIILALVATFAIRLLLSFLPSFSVDMGTWLAWAGRLAEVGPGRFYSDAVWTQYTPGFLYWLWLAGSVGWLSDLMIKIPVIFADIATGALIWWVVRKTDKRFANLAFFFYVLNPIVIFNGSVWGQIDGIFTLFLFLSAFFLVEKKNPILSGIFWAISFLIKPQAIAILSALAFIAIKKYSLKELVISGFLLLSTLFILSLPFFPKNPIFGLPLLVSKMSSYYSYTSVFAFNLWSLAGMWKPDKEVFVGSPLFWWGIVLYLASLLVIFLKFRKNVEDKGTAYLIFALASFSFFLFPTRVHERYLFPFFAFFLTYAGLKKSKGLLLVYGITSLFHLLNLYHPYSYYEKAANILKIEILQKLTGELAPLIGIVLFVIFLTILFWDRLGLDVQIERLINQFSAGRKNIKEKEERFEEIKLSPKMARIFLVLILTFAFATRIFQLGSPPKEYFDEVYHAFTAKVILHGDPKAWEWWNTPPEGFAYEWTHPPLAKLAMVAGMKIFGENPFGYRIPGALLGVGSVLIVYLITKYLWADEALALISSGVFSLDGLGLVMARIGMNDSYILFFSLLAIYLFLKNKNFFAAGAYGLALSSKWSALWVIPILFVAHIIFKKKLRFSYLWFFVLPPAVYLATYIPMFLTGHGLNIWWGMQEQMWWYHTRLKATHPYTSPWWTWPFLLRPIYLYTSDEIGGWVSRIYAMGNPLVFWFGLVSVASSAVYAFFERNKKLAWVIFSYLVFFTPWALSPRIMFLYHYLPSVPFLAIATGYVLRRYPKLITYYLLVITLVFIYFYPHFAGLPVPLWLDKSYYWFSSWR